MSTAFCQRKMNQGEGWVYFQAQATLGFLCVQLAIQVGRVALQRRRAIAQQSSFFASHRFINSSLGCLEVEKKNGLANELTFTTAVVSPAAVERNTLELVATGNDVVGALMLLLGAGCGEGFAGCGVGFAGCGVGFAGFGVGGFGVGGFGVGLDGLGVGEGGFGVGLLATCNTNSEPNLL